MRSALRTLRSTVAVLAATATLVTAGVSVAEVARAATTYAATADVFVRPGPGMSYKPLGVLKQGATIAVTGPAKDGWLPVTFQGKKGYVYAKYLKAKAGDPASPPATARSTAVAVENVNVRKGPGTSYAKVGLITKGTKIGVTGKTSGVWSQVVFKGTSAWISSRYLKVLTTPTPSPTKPSTTPSSTKPSTSPTSTKPSTTPTSTKPSSPTSTKPSTTPTSTNPSTPTDDKLPAVVGYARATTELMLRSSGTADFHSYGDIPTGTVVSLTGAKTTLAAQIVWKGDVRWVNIKYLAPVKNTEGPSVPGLPEASGIRYATTALDIRSTSADKYQLITEVPKGTELAITGTVQNGRMQIIWKGALRWVTAKYLSATRPSSSASYCSGCSGLTRNGKLVLTRVQSEYPQITRIGGVRRDALPDHPSGRALDLMINDYKKNRAFGWEVAKYLRAHASELHIQYIIFDQHIWNISRNSEGWRLMANRGGDTVNHKDHVHVTVKK